MMTEKRFGACFAVFLFSLSSWPMNNDDGRRSDLANSSATQSVEQSECPLGLSENERDFEEWWAACLTGNETATKDILDDGMDPEERIYLINQQMDVSHKSLTCLMIAAIVNYPSVATLLLRHGADITLKSTDGKTALDYAVDKGRNEIIRAILIRIITDSWR